jgi:hypothetical protein
MSKINVKRRKTYDLRLTKFELLHLRDLFGILLPPDAKQTMSQALAELENRSLVETMLWKKIAIACESADLPMGDDAPDYVAAPASPPPISVFQLSSDPTGKDDMPSDSDNDEDA